MRLQKWSSLWLLRSKILKIVIRQLYGNDVFNVLELSYQRYLAVNRVGFNNGHDPAIRQYAMNLDAIYRCYPQCDTISACRYARQHNP